MPASALIRRINSSQNKVVVFDRGDHKAGDYVRVRVTGCTSATLFGEELK